MWCCLDLYLRFFILFSFYNVDIHLDKRFQSVYVRYIVVIKYVW